MEVIKYICNEICCNCKLCIDLVHQFVADRIGDLFGVNRTGL